MTGTPYTHRLCAQARPRQLHQPSALAATCQGILGQATRDTAVTVAASGLGCSAICPTTHLISIFPATHSSALYHSAGQGPWVRAQGHRRCGPSLHPLAGGLTTVGPWNPHSPGTPVHHLSNGVLASRPPAPGQEPSTRVHTRVLPSSCSFQTFRVNSSVLIHLLLSFYP